MRALLSSPPLALAALSLLSQSPNQLSVDAFGVSHRPSAHAQRYPPSAPLHAESDDSLISSVDDVIAAANDAVREAEEALRNPSIAAAAAGDVGIRREDVNRLQNRIDDAEAEIGRLVSAEATYPKENAFTKFMNFRSDTDVAAEKAKNRRLQLEQDVTTWKAQLAEAKEAVLNLEGELEFASDPNKSMSSAEAKQQLAKERAELAETEQKAKEEENKLREKNEREVRLIEEVKSTLEAAQANFETKQAQVENQLAEGSKKRTKIVEGMASRYQAIRADIAQLLKGSNNSDNTSTEEAIERLQGELGELEAESKKLSVEREILAMSKEQLTSDQKAVDERIATALEEKKIDNEQLIKDIAELQSRGDVYKQEVAILQSDLAAELAAKESLEAQMKDLRDAFQTEQKQLTEKNKKIEAELSAKSSSIQRKYDSLRKDMIDILAREKTAAREREILLLEKHAGEIKRKNEVIGGLEAALSASQTDNTVLRAKNVDLTKQRDAALAAVDDLQGSISDQTLTISSLERAVASGEMKIGRYEGSLREQFKLSIRLTRKRIGNGVKTAKKVASSQFKKLKGKASAGRESARGREQKTNKNSRGNGEPIPGHSRRYRTTLERLK